MIVIAFSIKLNLDFLLGATHSTWAKPVSAFLGLVVAILAGHLIVGPLLNRIDHEIREKGVCTPFLWTDEQNVRKWENLVGRGGGGSYLGFLERILFFVTVYLGNWEVAGGWLLFKLGSKWESWKIVGEPSKESLGASVDGMTLLLARRQWATLGYQSFLVGTLTNALIAFLAVAVAKWPY